MSSSKNSFINNPIESEQESEVRKFLIRGLMDLRPNPQEEVPPDLHAELLALAKSFPTRRKGILERLWLGLWVPWQIPAPVKTIALASILLGMVVYGIIQRKANKEFQDKLGAAQIENEQLRGYVEKLQRDSKDLQEQMEIAKRENGMLKAGLNTSEKKKDSNLDAFLESMKGLASSTTEVVKDYISEPLFSSSPQGKIEDTATDQEKKKSLSTLENTPSVAQPTLLPNHQK